MFVPLHEHSQYSILDASSSVEAIAEKAAAFGLPAVALTDHGNLFGAIEFYKACKDVKVKPILGVEFYIAPNSRLEKTRIQGLPAAFHLTLLAKDREGYQNLCKLSSIGYLEGFYYTPRIDEALLKKHSKGLICLSGCSNSRLAHDILNGNESNIKASIEWYKDVFGEDYYFELQRHHMSEDDIQADGLFQEGWLLQRYRDFIDKQKKINAVLVALSSQYRVPLVATNDSHYIEREDWRAHEVLINIQSGEPCEIWEKDSYGNPKSRVPNPKRETYPSHEFYFKSPQQMEELFKDIPESISSTLAIAEKCNVEIDFKTKHYPVYTPQGLSSSYTKEEQALAVEKFLWNLCEEGIQKRYTPERLEKVKEIYHGKDPLDIIRKRLDEEMSVIVPKGMADYLLIVWDFIDWAKRNGIPVGPGRGSGAGSIVLYLIGITDIEPLRFHLFFERFINPERISYPDIDVDICMDRRGDVIAYTLQKYGKDSVAQIITFGTMKARMTIKDIGRVLSVPLSKVNEIAKLVPDDLNITLEKALEKDPDLKSMYEGDSETTLIMDLGKKLEGSIRNTGIHAAGIIISGQPLMELIPIANAKDSDMPVTQFSMKPVEAVGMLKVDFLGLKTLTAVKMCVDAIKASSGHEIDWVNLPLDDAATFDLLNQGKTLGIFQLESGGMQDLARQLHLDKFEEIIAVGALYRPGPMDMIPSFINRKHGREAIEIDHPWMKDILGETYGIMVYQEQVMQIASKLANFSLGEGDVLRRAMGKKDMDQMAKQREKFRLGAAQNGIDATTSMLIFDKMEKFAAYGFNKSHAAAYGYLSYVTAYLKANYPREWMAALMTCDRDDLSKVAKFIRECQSMGIPILPPDVNESGDSFVATQQGIRFAMSGIKGIGSGVVEAIVQERKQRGPFKNFTQFFKRMDAKKVGKKVVESMVEAGCFDFTGWTRDELVESIDPIFTAVSKEQKEEAQGVLSLFSLMGESTEGRFAKPPKTMRKRSKQEVLRKEKELLGFFLTGHPMDDFLPILQRLSCIPLRKVGEMAHDTVFRSAFIVESMQVKISAKTQKKFAILIISDGIERAELPIWADLYEEKSHLLLENQILYAVLQIDKKGEETHFSCRWLDDLTKADEAMIESCDRAYDKAKQQAARFSHQAKAAPSSKKEGAEKMKQKEEKKKAAQLSIKMNADHVRFSHIMQMKKLFSEFRGSIPVKIDFHAEGVSIAHMDIDSRWGVNGQQDIQEALQQVSSVLAVEFR